MASEFAPDKPLERIATEVLKLPVILTDDEVRERGEELAKTLQAIDQAALDADSARQKYKKITKELLGKQHQLATAVAGRREYRDVTVEVKADFERGIAYEIRTDTGEVLRHRSLRPEEFQRSIPGVDMSAEGPAKPE